MQGIGAVVICAGLVCFASCTIHEEPDLTPSAFRRDLSLLAPEEFAAFIVELEDIPANHEDPGIRMQALYHASLACLHYNNPAPDYAQALRNLDAYMAVDTGPARETRGIAVWQFVLAQMVATLQNYEKLQDSYAELRQRYRSIEKNRDFLGEQIEDLSRQIAEQKKEIAGLEDKIKKLDALYAEIEKKKKKK